MHLLTLPGLRGVIFTTFYVMSKYTISRLIFEQQKSITYPKNCIFLCIITVCVKNCFYLGSVHRYSGGGTCFSKKCRPPKSRKKCWPPLIEKNSVDPPKSKKKFDPPAPLVKKMSSPLTNIFIYIYIYMSGLMCVWVFELPSPVFILHVMCLTCMLWSEVTHARPHSSIVQHVHRQILQVPLQLSSIENMEWHCDIS